VRLLFYIETKAYMDLVFGFHAVYNTRC